MMKNFVVGVIFCSFLAGTAVAGPFGLSMGMKKSDFKTDLKEISPYKYETKLVPKKHNAFELYIVKIGPKSGLCYIKAVGKDIGTSTYGTDVLSAFDEMEGKLNKTYGNNKRYDFLGAGSIWDEPKDWMPGLLKKERRLASFWSVENGSTLTDNLQIIALVAEALNTSTGYLSLDYGFTNFDECEAEIAATEDSAL